MNKLETKFSINLKLKGNEEDKIEYTGQLYKYLKKLLEDVKGSDLEYNLLHLDVCLLHKGVDYNYTLDLCYVPELKDHKESTIVVEERETVDDVLQAKKTTYVNLDNGLYFHTELGTVFDYKEMLIPVILEPFTVCSVRELINIVS